MRLRERKCVAEELRSAGYGEVVFPRYYRSGEDSWGSRHRYYYPVKRIRKEYATDIRNILNGYHDNRRDFEEAFLQNFAGIKEGFDPGRWIRFEWMEVKPVREAIRAWEGNPVDIIYFLNRAKLIEQAVRVRQKEMLRK
jgi:hypothetical protein